MCGGVQFDDKGKTIKVYFPNPNARLPVLTRQGQTLLVPWGRREVQPGLSPLGGWARRESVIQGVWQRFQPRPVKIIVDAFMEKDTNDQSVWHPMPKNHFIQGLITTDNGFARLYVITEESNNSHYKNNRWPRLLMDKDLSNRAPVDRLF